LPQRGSIKTNNNPNVRNAGKVLSAVLEVQAELASILPKEGADAAATATNATEYKAALKALVDKLITSKKLNDADQQTLKALESLLGGFTKETPSADVRTVIHTNIGKQLKALEGFQKQPLLPHYDELVTTVKDSQDKDVKAFVRDLPAHQIEIFTERMLNAGTLDPINAQAITVMSDFNKNADLLKLVADNLAQASADQKHPLHGIQTARTESLRNAVEAFAGGIDTNTDGAAAKAIAEKLAKVLGELRNPTKDPAQNASTLATTLGLNVDADKSHLDLLVKHHGNNNNVETIAKYLSEQLTAIQAAPKPVVQTTP
ncbi:MAG: hypothetical protein NTW61_01235, partial [Candidatus Melainabacteria bacterium]|nr:hypothetical protein [Candidatus Melainabacteria bacterium]